LFSLTLEKPYSGLQLSHFKSVAPLDKVEANMNIYPEYYL